MGINVFGKLSLDEFEKRVRRFLWTITEAHPRKPVFAIDLFSCKHDLSEGENHRKAKAFRRIVSDAVSLTHSPFVHYLDGRALLYPSRGLVHDLVHPSPHGMEDIARNLSTALAEAEPRLFKLQASE